MVRFDSLSPRQRLWLVCAGLVGLVCAAFWQVARCEFLIYDDFDYVFVNDMVRRGLTGESIGWAFQKFHAANWHPVTWLSHMVDVELYGLRPAGHHVTNLLLHTANTVLLLVLLNRLTGSLWRSALVAALFGLHPTHVESVAWVAERKDVLSTFFGLLSLMAYARYVLASPFGSAVTCHRFPTRRHVSQFQSGDMSPHSKPDGAQHWLGCLNMAFRSPAYWLTGLFLALGLMSKPMLVTWPFVMLLLDFWPLGRTPLADGRWQMGDRKLWGRLVLEKIPFFALTLGSCVITFFAQRAGGAVQSIEQLSPLTRFGNSAVSYMRYLGKTVLPVDLSIFYPYPPAWSGLLIAGAFLLLAGLVITAGLNLRRRPYLLFGLCWFLGTLVPVIGLVQVGAQSMADRYQYIPQIGLFIAMIWFLGESVVARINMRGPVVGVALLSLGACFFLTQVRVRDWQNSETIFTQALRVTKDNFIAHNNLGLHYQNVRKYEQAIASFNAALTIRPAYAPTYNNLGLAYAALTKPAEANASFEEALRLDPTLYPARVNLASVYHASGRLSEALQMLDESVRIAPDYPEGRCCLANVLSELGRLDEATQQAQAALKIRPDYAEAINALGTICLKQGRLEDARKNYQAALKANPVMVEAQSNLGLVLAAQGKYHEAVEQYEAALQLKPNFLPAHLGLALVLGQSGKIDESARYWASALKLSPDLWAAHEQMGMLLVKQGKLIESLPHFVKAVEHLPDNHRLLAHYGLALDQLGETRQALDVYRRTIKLNENQPEVLNNLSWILATSAAADLRAGAEAVRLGELVCRLTDFKEARFIGTLAAAYAEAGRFDEAVATARRAIVVAQAAGQLEVVARNTELAELYAAKKPYHEAAPTSPEK